MLLSNYGTKRTTSILGLRLELLKTPCRITIGTRSSADFNSDYPMRQTRAFPRFANWISRPKNLHFQCKRREPED
jgi:hypothetical protein